MIFKGISSALIVVPSICELINVLNKYGVKEDFVNDIASSIWNLGNYLGEAFGPLIGGIVTARYSFPMSCNVVSIINFFFGLIYSIYARKMIKDEIFNENKISKKQLTFSGDLKSAKELNFILEDELIKYTVNNGKSENAFNLSLLN